jgi:hypothetical protein
MALFHAHDISTTSLTSHGQYDDDFGVASGRQALLHKPPHHRLRPEDCVLAVDGISLHVRI